MMIDLEPAARLLMSAFFGALVGIERQWRHKNAGLKTNALVSVGATSFGLIALQGFGPGSQPTHIAAGVVTGVGFIGAGVIMHRGGSLQGINSAATLWAAAGMGLALGQGSYALSGYILGVVLITQFSLQWGTNYINRRSGVKLPLQNYHLSLGVDASKIESVRRVWSDFVQEFGVSVTSYREERAGPAEVSLEASFQLPSAPADGANSLVQPFAQVDGLIRLDCEKSVPQEQA
jgi:putative Mg2+ transporter-C (MgtC) family protein